MSNLEYIDDYFKSVNTSEQKEAFEQRITNDLLFAEEVALYISANEVAKQQATEEKKQRFRAIYDEQKVKHISAAPRWKTMRYLVAASVTGILLTASMVLFFNNDAPQQMADKYVTQNWQTLGVTMGNDNSTLQKGLDLYNAGNFKEAIAVFKNVLKEDNTNNYALRYTGIGFYKSAQYDSALVYFNTLASDTVSRSNPGKLYMAVTLLKRNSEGDEKAAKDLLQEIVAKDLEGKSVAEKWLQKFK